MRSIISIAMLGALATFTLPVFAANEEPKAETPADKKICRREEVLGSVIPKRVCHTAAEWKQIDTASQSNAERLLAKQRMSGPVKPLN
jgi:hypothetical protein